MSSKESNAVIRYLQDAGVPFRVNAVDWGVHSAGTYHYQWGTPTGTDPTYDGRGLGLDLDGPNDWPADLAGKQLLDIFYALDKRRSFLRELICSWAPYSVKNGLKVPRYAISAHWSHVHTAIGRGTFLTWNPPVPVLGPPAPVLTVVKPMYDPPIIMPNIVASLKAPNGGVWLLGIHGEIYAFEAPDYDAPNRHPEYWNNRTAAKLEANSRGGYDVIASDGGRYSYPV